MYKAQHLRLGKVRAVKVLAQQLLDNPEGVFKPGMPADAYFGGAPAGAAGG